MNNEADQAQTAQAPRARLSLSGVSPDRQRLLLVDDQGAPFTLAITPDLRAAVRGETTRLGQLEIKMTSSIRPREIQTRVRAGESAETIAEAAGTTVEAIMAYVAPVLAERGHVAERAQKASLRRGPGGGELANAQSRVLGEAVEARLRAIGADPSAVAWDAYRRETGRWVLSAEFTSSERSGTARFTFDAPGNYILSDNDEARWLIGESVPAPASPPDDLQQVRQRRLAAVPEELPLGDNGADELPLGDDALGLVAGEAATGLTEQPSGADELPLDEPIRATVEATGETEEDAAARAAAEAEAARHRRPVQKKRGRASVPSWDEIMFGGSDQA